MRVNTWGFILDSKTRTVVYFSLHQFGEEVFAAALEGDFEVLDFKFPTSKIIEWRHEPGTIHITGSPTSARIRLRLFFDSIRRFTIITMLPAVQPEYICEYFLPNEDRMDEFKTTAELAGAAGGAGLNVTVITFRSTNRQASVFLQFPKPILNPLEAGVHLVYQGPKRGDNIIHVFECNQIVESDSLEYCADGKRICCLSKRDSRYIVLHAYMMSAPIDIIESRDHLYARVNADEYAKSVLSLQQMRREKPLEHVNFYAHIVRQSFSVMCKMDI